MAQIAAVVLVAVGSAISAIAKANALRAEARARQIEGEQELLSSRRQLRQELGQAAVSVGASGLLGSSFANVFQSQAIEDAEFLGRIKQRTDFDVASLRKASKVALITGLIGAGAQAFGGIAGVRQGQGQVAFAERQATRQAIARGRQRNIFATTSPAGKSPFRISTKATFF